MNVKPRLTSVSSGAEIPGTSLHIFTTLIISSLAWTIISTVLQPDLTVTTNVTAASNKLASLVIGKQSLSTLSHAVANWWPISPRPASLHHSNTHFKVQCAVEIDNRKSVRVSLKGTKSNRNKYLSKFLRKRQNFRRQNYENHYLTQLQT